MTVSSLEARQKEIMDRMDSVLEVFSSQVAEHEEQHRWIKMAIKREAQSIALREAIIEKSLGGLAWAAIAGFGILVVTYLRAHGWVEK